MQESASEYYRGVVDEYNDREGYGYISPDPDQSINGVLQFHRAALRSRTMRLRRGDRVLFSVEDLQQGGSASDVHPEFVEDGELEPRVWGNIDWYLPERGFGFVEDRQGQRAFFHISSFLDDNVIPAIGLGVTYKLVRSQKGLQAQDLALADGAPETGRADWLAQAILARDARKYEDAARLYDKGLRHEPTVQLILSYAAMEKNRNRKAAAMRVYEEGIKRIPTNAKLREDAGTLAASLSDFRVAVRFLEEALAICRRTQQGGEKGVLLGLARAHYQIDTLTSLHESIRYYEKAHQLFGQGRTQLPENDLLRLNIARIRTQHHRGNLCVSFLKRAQFEIVRASLLEQITAL